MRQLIAGNHLKNKRSALDIGCNAGFYSKVISDFGFASVFGVDIVPEYVARASAAFHSDLPGKKISFQVMDATLLPHDRLYDFILCTEVIEHTSKPEVVIASIMSLLAPEGVAVISLPNSISLGYFTSYLAARLTGRAISPELRDHLNYPFFKGPALFQKNGASILARAGVNALFNDRLLLVASSTPLFPALNRLNFWLSCHWPLRCVAQFYFFAISSSVRISAGEAHKRSSN